jgi:hypothetical protein
MKQFFAKRLFQGFKLGAHGRLGEPELSAGSRHATDSPNRPEIKQVMVIEPFHAGIIVRFFL